jgi:hypothetical protein
MINSIQLLTLEINFIEYIQIIVSMIQKELIYALGELVVYLFDIITS